MTRLHLSKENLKFSAAHFLIFDAVHAEKLHGHNYQVSLELEGPAQAGTGLLVNFADVKRIVKKHVDAWDEHVLLPKLHPEMKFESKAPSLHVHFRDRYYVFPENEVILLATANTSVEELSRLLAENLMKEFKPLGVTGLELKVEETRGQGASFRIGC